MPPPKNAMEIYQYLNKSNCRECGDQTCLAFAGSVYTGRRAIGACPYLDDDIIQKFSGQSEGQPTPDESRYEYLETLKTEISKVDLAQTANRIGATYSDGRLQLKIMGKAFSVDATGSISTGIHVNPWVAIPFLHYVVKGKAIPITGNWVSFRELRGGKEFYGLFQKRCEEPIKRIADGYTDLFDDLVHMFSGQKVAQQFESDISVVLHPLPLVPVMICYWLPEDGLASSLNLFFDESADRNLSIESVYTLAAGLAQMFEKISHRHGTQKP